jgi:peroxiredoxin
MSPPEVSESENSQQNGRNPLVLIAGFVLLALALGLLLFGSSLFGSDSESDTAVLEQVPAFNEAENGMPQLPTGAGPLTVGDLAYDFSLQDLAGNVVNLTELNGRPVIVNFWASWCGPCRIEMPELQAVYEEYQDDGLVILALDNKESARVVDEFFHQEMGLTFTPLLDSEGSVADLYGVGRTFPSTFFINPAGEITAIHRGMMVKSQIDGYLAETFPQG